MTGEKDYQSYGIGTAMAIGGATVAYLGGEEAYKAFNEAVDFYQNNGVDSFKEGVYMTLTGLESATGAASSLAGSAMAGIGLKGIKDKSESKSIDDKVDSQNG
ncbi:MAG: hypothetical protein ABEI74_01590 [Candidatus Pacearchaeota archaeon]